ncbi:MULTISPECIES: hypothetical protein [Sphingomonas]|jgi:hypothetical protein|uniref:Uncharacterized protein n=1 Tax=Sphingomonas echinoides TaxID=59803 RepID=A0ABU4PQ03_9SPHN|nr:hypothetical protein [Sphingomonas echinoides]MDX5986221.1 hypothetical protein [Sphingomonas echinoides]
MSNGNSYARPFAALTAVGLLVVGLSAPAMAASTKSIQKTEDALLAAGFVDRPASTPERVAMIAQLPKNRFIRRVKGQMVHYVYADTKNCNCIYVGTQQAYGAYVKAMQAQKLADTQQMAAEDYANPAWNWGAWGGFNRGWGFGRYRGW